MQSWADPSNFGSRSWSTMQKFQITEQNDHFVVLRHITEGAMTTRYLVNFARILKLFLDLISLHNVRMIIPLQSSQSLLLNRPLFDFHLEFLRRLHNLAKFLRQMRDLSVNWKIQLEIIFDIFLQNLTRAAECRKTRIPKTSSYDFWFAMSMEDEYPSRQEDSTWCKSKSFVPYAKMISGWSPRCFRQMCRRWTWCRIS